MDKNTTVNNKKKRRHSLAAKTVHSMIRNCVIFGLVAQLVALAFYAVSSTNQLIDLADGIAHQAIMSATHGTDTISFSNRVMDTYYSLSDEELAMNGSDEYRELFADVGMEKGGSYDVLVHMLGGMLESYDVYDVYVAMYDEENSRIVYIADSDENVEDRLYPGEWENVNREGMEKFLNWDGKGKLYDIEKTDKYGLLCTVGLPIRDDSGNICSFMLVDVSVDNVLSGMAEFAARLSIVLVALTILLAWLQTRKIKNVLVKPINQIAEASQSYASDRLAGMDNSKMHFAALDIHTGDELEDLCSAMKNMEHELSNYESNLTQITAEKQRISTELSLATQIQYAMLPHIFPPYPERTEFDIYATMEPAREVG
ncbi:MAG: hypothetical protein II936_06345 [Oscillospiraceae bacterium]|nr:hypothetical protein [Oscillospiraceae bacterium]